MPEIPGSYYVSRSIDNAFRAVLAQAGLLLPLPEAQIDAASAISGCGPAFCFQFADALALGGVRAGLSYPDACRLAAKRTDYPQHIGVTEAAMSCLWASGSRR